MPRTRECDFCGDDIEPGTGTMFVQVDGTTTHFCSAKCEKNADLGREARDLEWTEAGQAAGGEAGTRQEQEPAAEPEASEKAEAPEAEGTPDLAAAEQEVDEPTAETPGGIEDRTPDDQTADHGSETAEVEASDAAEAAEAPGEQGDEAEEPVVDAGGGEEAEGVEDTEDDTEAEGDAEADVEEPEAEDDVEEESDDEVEDEDEAESDAESESDEEEGS